MDFATERFVAFLDETGILGDRDNSVIAGAFAGGPTLEIADGRITVELAILSEFAAAQLYV